MSSEDRRRWGQNSDVAFPAATLLFPLGRDRLLEKRPTRGHTDTYVADLTLLGLRGLARLLGMT